MMIDASKSNSNGLVLSKWVHANTDADLSGGCAESQDVMWEYNGHLVGKILSVPESIVRSRNVPHRVLRIRRCRYDVFLYDRWRSTDSGWFRHVGEFRTHGDALRCLQGLVTNDVA